MSLSLDEKRKSLNNSKSEILEARVIANYNDPGILENYQFDVLSRYVIVMIESGYRVPTIDKWNKLFAIVARPKQLWINVEEGKAITPNSQKRSDSTGNINVGLAESPSVSGIPKINSPYEMGELIKIKKLVSPLKVGADSFFVSQFNETNQPFYQNWHTEGSTLPYFAGQQSRIDALKAKTIIQLDNSNLFLYMMTLYKYQYEAFMLNIVNGNSELTNHITSIFANTLPSSSPIYDAYGGYVFKNTDYINFTAVEYEDINVGNKQRITSNECTPLIVSTPNSFPTPKVRSLGTVTYNPTYVIKN